MQVDGLCNGKITDRTPPEAIVQGYLVDFSPIVESYDPTWVTASKKWASTPDTGTGSAPKSTYITSVSDTICERPNSSEVDISLTSDLQDGGTRPLGRGVVQVKYSSTYPVKHIVMTRAGVPFYSLYPEEMKTNESLPISLNFGPEFNGTQTIGLTVVDIYGYSARNTATINFGGKSDGPKIVFENPPEGDGDISVYEGQAFNLRFNVSDPVGVSAVNLYLDGALLQILGAGTTFAIPFGADLAPGRYSLEVQSVSETRQRSKKAIEVEVLRK